MINFAPSPNLLSHRILQSIDSANFLTIYKPSPIEVSFAVGLLDNLPYGVSGIDRIDVEAACCLFLDRNI